MLFKVHLSLIFLLFSVILEISLMGGWFITHVLIDWQVPDSDTEWWISDQEEELLRLLSDSRDNLHEALQTDIIQCLLAT